MTIGIVGGGQLGRMLAIAGYPLGLDFLFLDRSHTAPAGQVAPLIAAELSDHERLRELASRSDVVTFDWENVPVESLRGLPCPVRPSRAALAAAQDRVSEKRLFERLGIPTTRWRSVESRSDLARALSEIGLPAMLKTRRLGYDGKGQAALRTRGEAEAAWERLGARGVDGATVFYPLCLNTHAGGILRVTCAPYGRPRLQRLAERHLGRVLVHFRYVGVLTIEFFVRAGRLIANEMAPRVHNSGHWTIEGAATSQFENHVRAVAGLPLGQARPLGHSAMINLIGRMPPRARILAHAGLHLHDYGKEPRPGRKLGHCTFVASSAHARDAWVRRLLPKLAPDIRIP